MRYMNFATAALLGVVSVSAMAQAQSMVGASDATPADVTAGGVPAVPSIPLDDPTLPRDHLRDARAQLDVGHVYSAHNQLEMAATRLLGGAIAQDQTAVAAADPRLLSKIQDALHALDAGDRDEAIQAIDIALSD
jgi:hypothetical protein